MRASQPALLTAARVIAETRDSIVAAWRRRLGDRIAASPTVPQSFIHQQMDLIVDLIGESAGPFRREVTPLWHRAMELYGRMASLRGLAAGEVVEELQPLRELLTQRLAPVLLPMRPRQAMALLLRLDRTFDTGIATAVVGYTDALVATLFAQGGVPPADAAHDLADLERRTTELALELRAITHLA